MCSWLDFLTSGDNNYVFGSHLCAFLHHGMPWPLSCLFMHHYVHGPRVAFAPAPKQIKGLDSLLLRCSGHFRP